jgi:hypothetical protein
MSELGIWNSPYRDLAYGDLGFGTFSPEIVFAGEAPIVTNARLFLAGNVVPKYTVLMSDGAQKLVAWTASNTAPCGIAAQQMDTSVTGTDADTIGPFFEGGCFNFAVLNIPEGVTLLELQEAFVPSKISIRDLDQPVLNPIY